MNEEDAFAYILEFINAHGEPIPGPVTPPETFIGHTCTGKCDNCGRHFCLTMCPECRFPSKRETDMAKRLDEIDRKIEALWYAPGAPGYVESQVDFEEQISNKESNKK